MYNQCVNGWPRLGPSRFATKDSDIEFESSFSFRFMLMAVLVESGNGLCE